MTRTSGGNREVMNSPFFSRLRLHLLATRKMGETKMDDIQGTMQVESIIFHTLVNPCGRAGSRTRFKQLVMLGEMRLLLQWSKHKINKWRDTKFLRIHRHLVMVHLKIILMQISDPTIMAAIVKNHPVTRKENK